MVTKGPVLEFHHHFGTCSQYYLAELLSHFLTAGEGSESDCGADRTGFDLRISSDHQQLVGELRRSSEILHKAELVCVHDCRALYAAVHTCGREDKFF